MKLGNETIQREKIPANNYPNPFLKTVRLNINNNPTEIHETIFPTITGLNDMFKNVKRLNTEYTMK